MELVKKNIQTDRIKAKTLLQLPIEEDINVFRAVYNILCQFRHLQNSLGKIFGVTINKNAEGLKFYEIVLDSLDKELAKAKEQNDKTRS